MNSRGVVEGEMGAILKGPHIKRAVNSRYMTVQPLQFFRVVYPALQGGKVRIARVPS